MLQEEKLKNMGKLVNIAVEVPLRGREINTDGGAMGGKNWEKGGGTGCLLGGGRASRGEGAEYLTRQKTKSEDRT